MNILVAAFFDMEHPKEGNSNTVNAERNSEPHVKIERTTKTCALPPVSEKAKPTEELEKLGLHHFSDSHCKKLRNMCCITSIPFEGFSSSR